MPETQYFLRKAANGWIVETSPDSQIFVFESARDLGEWLASRHEEGSGRRLVEDWK